MPFRKIVFYTIKCHSGGYYAVRQNMLANGASLHDVATVLVNRLRILGA